MISYLQVGIDHILDVNGYDHMLFIAVLLSGVSPKAWKSVLWLITAFTIGHSLTLAYTVLFDPLIPSAWVEFFIPITIMLTAAGNFRKEEKSLHWKVVITICFGLIHGMGFAGYLSSLLPPDMPLWQPLLFFNLGVELGQILFAAVLVGLFLLTRYITENAVRPAQIGLSIVGFGVSLLLAIEKWPLS